MAKYSVWIIFLAIIFVSRADVYEETSEEREAATVLCSEVNPCKEMPENCSRPGCGCDKGYVSRGRRCFPERNYGETCFFSFQCTLHPLVCSDYDDDEVRRCDCHSLFQWNVELGSCVHAENASAQVSLLGERWFLAARIEAEVQRIFPGVVTAGILSLCIGALLASGCVVYGCFRGSCKPRGIAENEVAGMNSGNEGAELIEVRSAPQQSTSQA